MDLCREKRIHPLRQLSSLLPSFSLKQRSASCATGADTMTFFHQPVPGKTPASLPAHPASGTLFWRGRWQKKCRILYSKGWKWWHLSLLPSWEHPQLLISTKGFPSLNPLCIWTKLPATSKQLLFFTLLLCNSAFLLLWSRDREKWDGSQLEFAGSRVIYCR